MKPVNKLGGLQVRNPKLTKKIVPFADRAELSGQAVLQVSGRIMVNEAKRFHRLEKSSNTSV
jgi:hypothetical protein